MKRAVGGVLLAAIVGLSGCGGDGGQADKAPSPSPTQSGTGEIGIPPGETGNPTYPPGKKPMSISLARTGGVAGVDQRIQVTAEGAWTYTSDGDKKTGTLSAQQVSKLQSLAMDKRLRAEAEIKDKPTCADGFQYELRAGPVSMTAFDCGGDGGRPAFNALVDYLVETTPM